MDKEEVKQEHKQQELPAEIKGAQRRRAMELARARMMDAVPTADVVVTNPTHFSVALKYDGDEPGARSSSPRASTTSRCGSARPPRTHGVAVVPDPPLARALYASVEVGQHDPRGALPGASPQLLAYVYRVAGARRAAA